MLFRLRNAATNNSRVIDAALTARIDREVLAGMHSRYRTAFNLDDEFSGSQSGCMKNNNNTAQPLPWGVLLAIVGLALSLSMLFCLALTGGIDLG